MAPSVSAKAKADLLLPVDLGAHEEAPRLSWMRVQGRMCVLCVFLVQLLVQSC